MWWNTHIICMKIFCFTVDGEREMPYDENTTVVYNDIVDRAAQLKVGSYFLFMGCKLMIILLPPQKCFIY